MKLYRRDGTPYPDSPDGLLEYAHDREEKEKCVVRQDLLMNGYWVSTVWMGVAMNMNPLSARPPLIFETMCFDPFGEIFALAGPPAGIDTDNPLGYLLALIRNRSVRYATEADAIVGHMENCDTISQVPYALFPPDLPALVVVPDTMSEIINTARNLALERRDDVQCRICVANNLPTFTGDTAVMADHLETVHGMPVIRGDETFEAAVTRLANRL